jgi:hypothetical protein
MIYTTAKGETVRIEGYAPYTDRVRSGNGAYLAHQGSVMIEFNGFSHMYVGRFDIPEAKAILSVLQSAIEIAEQKETVT